MEEEADAGQHYTIVLDFFNKRIGSIYLVLVGRSLEDIAMTARNDEGRNNWYTLGYIGGL